ncbi:hypothetical protein KXW98_007873 [Aspergillus fumigatus]|jgi:uncharacterized protein with PIN domain|nr:hypothetical protein CNMCM8689_001041 [Aspergillus fumigatus]KAH1272146.1 hypothetical protein KXX45_009635 [Aspergillus fumigatus]KAH1287957.1 hypothetical protein KXX30_008024 [Aspergillus fumigatus]KAH1289930.1 hypothetical protein KXX48_008138 [Aspergillus fumigatus]KAH1304882.1 hypothetical protein KXX66_003127 [Aspergillus fumigatus]
MSTTNPSASPSRSPAPRQQDDQPQHQEQEQQQQQQQQQRLKVHTHHCRFCNHLLLATTRTIATLPRRKAPAQDNALILPLPHADEDEDEDDDDDNDDEKKEEEKPDATTSPEPGSETNQTIRTEGEAESEGQAGRKRRKQKHYTILLSTTLPDRKATLIRREDGFEKRRFLRCGRCRVVVGYFLDAVHFPVVQRAEDVVEGEGASQEPRVVYLLPGALMETEIMGDEEKMEALDREWSGWIAQ